MIPISYCKDMSKRVKQIGPILFEVNGHIVKFQTKKGRLISTCDCQNSSRFAHHNLCSHKIACIIFVSNKEPLKRLNESIEIYERMSKLKKQKPFPMTAFVDELREVKREL